MTRWLLILSLLAAPLAAQEAVLPNGTTTVTNQGCTTGDAHTTMDDDPQSPGGDWCAATTNVDTLVKIQFATPSTDIRTGTDAQTFELYIRKDAATAPGNGVPTITIDAYNGGTLIETGAIQNVTSDTGQLLTETWTSNTADGSGIEVDLPCTATGGGPNKRSCDFDAVRWIATLATGERIMIIGQIKSITRGAK